MFKINLLLISTLFSLSLSAMDNKKRQENFIDDQPTKKRAIDSVAIPPLPYVLWGKIYSYLPEKPMTQRLTSKIIKKAIDQNCHSIKIRGDLTKLDSLKCYLSNKEVKIHHVQFTGDLTSFSLFQTVATTIGGELRSLKGLHNDMAWMFKKGQSFDALFPQLQILHVFVDGDEEAEKSNYWKPTIYWKDYYLDKKIKHHQWDEVYTPMDELPETLRELTYKETKTRKKTDEDGLIEHEIGLSKFFKKCLNIEKIDLNFASSILRLEGMPDSVKELTLTDQSSLTDTLQKIMRPISRHKGIKTLRLNDFSLGEDLDASSFFPKNIESLSLIKIFLNNDKIFNAISNLCFLKKLELDLEADYEINIFLELPLIEELKLSYALYKPQPNEEFKITLKIPQKALVTLDCPKNFIVETEYY